MELSGETAWRRSFFFMAMMLQRMSPLLAQSRHALVHCKCPLSGVKRTWAVQYPLLVDDFAGTIDALLSLGAGNEASRFYRNCRFGGRVAVDGSRTAVDYSGDWVLTERTSFWRNASCHRFPYGSQGGRVHRGPEHHN